MPAVLFGLRLWASVTVALLVAFWLQLDNAYWAGTSAAIVAQPGLGASLRKGRFRAVGTVIGGVFIVILTAAFPQSRVPFLVSLALWTALCGYFATVLPNFAGYAAALAGYTAVIVFAAVIDNPQNVFLTAVSRTTEISIGIFSAALVHVLTAFGDARTRLARALADVGNGIAAGLYRALGAEPATLLELRATRRELIKRVTALNSTIDEALGEPSQWRLHPGALQATVEAFFSALSAWRGLGNHLYSEVSVEGRALVSALQPVFSKVAQHDWLNDPVAIRDICDVEVPRVEQLSVPDLSARLIRDQAVQALCALGRAANGLVLVTEPGSERPDKSGKRLHVPDALPGGLNALRVLVALIAAEALWIATSWPQGPTLIIFTALGILLFSPRADAAYVVAMQFAVGSAFAGILAAVLNLAVLPAMPEGFVSVAIVLAFVLVPAGALAERTWPQPAFTAIIALLLPILALENEPNYDGARLINAALAIGIGGVIAAVFMRLIPPLSPATRARRLLRLSLRDLRALAAGRRRFTREGWIGLASQRLGAMPGEATLEQEALLLSTLSVGEAAVALLDARPTLPMAEDLDNALRCLAEADVAGARKWLTRVCAWQPEGSSANAQQALRACTRAALISEALKRHPDFYASAA